MKAISHQYKCKQAKHNVYGEYKNIQNAVQFNKNEKYEKNVT